MMSDEALYLEATKEVDESRTDPAFWAKALAQSKGDLDKAKWLYIDLRVEAMKIQESPAHKEITAPNDAPELKNKASQVKKKSWNQRANNELVEGQDEDGFISVQEASVIAKESDESIISRIKDGELRGRVNASGEWSLHSDSFSVLTGFVGSTTQSNDVDQPQKPSVWRYVGAWIVWGIFITIIGWVVYGLNWFVLAIPQDAYWYPNISGMHLSYGLHLTNLAINTLFVILSFKWVYFHLQAFKGLDARKVLPWIYGFYILQVLVGIALLGLIGDRLPTRVEYSLFGMFAGLVSCLSIRHLVMRRYQSADPYP